MKALAVAAWFPAACLAPQQPAAPEQVVLAAVVTVDDTEQFCPTVWRLRIDAPAGEPVVVSRRPLVHFDRQRSDGEWEPANGATGGPDVAPPYSATGPLPFRWPVAAGQSFELCAEVADWRVLGYPGTYRASVVWAVAGDRALRRVVSRPFRVAPAGERRGELSAAMARGDRLWHVYRRAMEELLDIARKPASRGFSAPPGPFAFREPMHPFEAPDSAPAAVVTRQVFQRLVMLCRAVMGSRSGAERDQALEGALAQCRTLEAEPGLIGSLARLQRLVVLHVCERQEFAAALASAREDEALLAAARWYPEVARAIGLLSKDGAAPDLIPIPVAVTIDDTEQFCPTVCRFRIDVPVCCDDIVTQVPFVQFFRKMPSGEWWHAYGPPGGPLTSVASQLFVPAWPSTSEAPPPVLWRFRAGESTAFFGEVADWRVLGYAGTYQVKVRWAIEGAASGYATAEFEVRPAGDGSAALLAASAQSELWRAYQRFMNSELVVAEPMRWRPPVPPPSPEGLRFLAGLQGLPFEPCNTLLQAGTLPAGLRERIDLFQLRRPFTVANTMPDGDERMSDLKRCAVDYATFGTHPGFAGAFARLQALVLTKSCGTAAEFDAALARALQDRDLLDLGLSFPEAMQAVGLLVEDETFPQGPQGPLGSRILERR